MYSVYIKCYVKSPLGVDLSNIAKFEAESYNELLILFRKFKREFKSKYCEFVGKFYHGDTYLGEL